MKGPVVYGELRGYLIGVDALVANALVVADGEVALRLLGARELLAKAMECRACPNCGSIRQERIAGLWLCQSCGHEWDDDSAQQEQPDDIGLSIDMLDVDRLREWARLLLEYGPNINSWGSLPYVAGKMQQIATGIEKAIRDIGTLRAGRE